MTKRFGCKKKNLSSVIHRVSFSRISKDLVGRLTYLCPSYCQLNLILGQETRCVNSEETTFMTDFRLQNDQHDKLHVKGKFFGRFSSIWAKLPLVSTFLCCVLAQEPQTSRILATACSSSWNFKPSLSRLVFTRRRSTKWLGGISCITFLALEEKKTRMIREFLLKWEV